MLKCPFCQFDNEEGALFCDQCKSDLASAEAPGERTLPPDDATIPDEAPMAAVVEEAHHVPVAALAEAPTDLHSQPTIPPDVPAPMEVEPGQGTSHEIEGMGNVPVTVELEAGEPEPFAADAQPKLIVLRGQRVNVEYPIFAGDNFIGRADDKAVDIDLEDQEPPDRVWSSRQHAVIRFSDGRMVLEDLNSTNGTFVNRNRLHPGNKKSLRINDVIQIGTVQMKVKL